MAHMSNIIILDGSFNEYEEYHNNTPADLSKIFPTIDTPSTSHKFFRRFKNCIKTNNIVGENKVSVIKAIPCYCIPVSEKKKVLSVSNRFYITK